MPDLWSHISENIVGISSPAALAALGQVVLIDVLLAADNAVVVGALAAGLPPATRRRVILVGIVAALVLRIVFALLFTRLLQTVGLVFAGGLLLLWVAWKMWRELRLVTDGPGSNGVDIMVPRSFVRAAWSVAVADVSMSLDNVLAVAGAARAHPGVLVIGLTLSVALMGIAANVLARVIERHRWVAYFGLLVVAYVAARMMFDGWIDPTTGIAALLR